MRIAFVVNEFATELAGYSTSLLAMTAAAREHDVYYLEVSDIGLDSNGQVRFLGHRAPAHHYRKTSTYLDALRSAGTARDAFSACELDVLMLRNDPAADALRQPWARSAELGLARLAQAQGVIVLNDPAGLELAASKIYLQKFPEYVRPRAIVSRDPSEIKSFIATENGHAVLKPAVGSGGHNVFLVRPSDAANLNQIIDAVRGDGFVIAQEYLPEASRGDTRLFLLNGEPLCCEGHYAAMRRARHAGDNDMRSNLSAGASACKATVTNTMLELADALRPRLIADGMFLVGADIVGDKVIEINVSSPGGLPSAERFEGVRFAEHIIRRIERKVRYAQDLNRCFDNKVLATL